MTKKKGQVWELSDMPFSYILVLNKYIYIFKEFWYDIYIQRVLIQFQIISIRF